MTKCSKCGSDHLKLKSFRHYTVKGAPHELLECQDCKHRAWYDNLGKEVPEEDTRRKPE